MHKRNFLVFSLCLLISVFINISFDPDCGAKESKKAKIIAAGQILPDFLLPGPESEKAKEYLGLKEGKTFTLSQISGKLVLVEFYSMYCPVCQRQAPKTNKIFKFIQADPVLNKDIKVIGVGLTNKQKEIDIYRKNFRVKFPLFADPDKAIADKTGIKDIPLTLLVDKNGKVLLSHLGIVKKMDAFMNEIRVLHKKQ